MYLPTYLLLTYLVLPKNIFWAQSMFTYESESLVLVINKHTHLSESLVLESIHDSTLFQAA